MNTYNPDDPTQLGNWFDVYSDEHMRAFRELSATGVWPEWFQDLRQANGIEMHYNWDMVLRFKMAQAWMDRDVKGPAQKVSHPRF